MAEKTDVIIVGAGPLGIELAILLQRLDVEYIHLEAKQIGDTIANWPRQTQFYSAPERVALAGMPVHSPNQQSLTGEMYLSYLRSVVEQCQLEIRTYEPVTKIEQDDNGRFNITTQTQTETRHYQCQKIVLATGNMNRPRHLSIPGEELPHVDHALDDPHKYFQKRLLIVGGKNSALEAALRCWRAGAQVGISYRRDEFETSIIKPFLHREIELLIDKGKLKFFKQTVPQRIEKGQVYLSNVESGEETAVSLDFVLFCVGYVMDMSLYKQLGLTLDPDSQKPEVNPETMESTVPNVYVCGTAAGGMEDEHELFIMTSHEHAEKIAKAITGKTPPSTGEIPSRRYEISFDEIKED